MANSFFSFKQFTVQQDRCAMKVGTDGTLLGAWANGGNTILDIGTGTGLIALMMAQRFPSAQVTGIDIDADACLQASENAAASPFANRITVRNVAIQDFPAATFQSIVCNPPFFNDSLGCPDAKRHMARHTDSLSFPTLFQCASRLLDEGGTFAAVIPTDCMQAFDSAAHIEGFVISRKCAVRTVPRKAPKRVLVEYIKADQLGATSTNTPVLGTANEEQSIEDGHGQRSAWYKELTKDFYL